MLYRRVGDPPPAIVGVATAVGHSRWGTHAGIVFDDHLTKKLLHLRFHYDLAEEPAIPDNYAWSRLEIPAAIANIVSSICRGVWHHYGRGGLPFAINFVATVDSTGQVRGAGIGEGFTCATMVLGILDGARIKLIDKSRWSLRYDDMKWQWRVVGTLAVKGASRSFLISQILAIGCFRFRPEDVMAAGMMVASAPNGLNELRNLSNQIRDEINKLPFID